MLFRLTGVYLKTSKLPEKDADGRELDEAEEVDWVVLPSNQEESALPLNPETKRSTTTQAALGKAPFHSPNALFVVRSQNEGTAQLVATGDRGQRENAAMTSPPYLAIGFRPAS